MWVFFAFCLYCLWAGGLISGTAVRLHPSRLRTAIMTISQETHLPPQPSKCILWVRWLCSMGRKIIWYPKPFMLASRNVIGESSIWRKLIMLRWQSIKAEILPGTQFIKSVYTSLKCYDLSSKKSAGAGRTPAECNFGVEVFVTNVNKQSFWLTFMVDEIMQCQLIPSSFNIVGHRQRDSHCKNVQQLLRVMRHFSNL